MMKRVLAIICCTLSLIMVATGCDANGAEGSNGSEGSNRTDANTIKIGISMPAFDEVTQNMRGTYEECAAEMGGVELVFTDAGNDTGQQTKDVEDLISQQCDVIVIRPVDGTAIDDACNAAAAANIPIVIDTNAVSTTNYAVRVVDDPANHGRALGEYLQVLLDSGDINEVKIGYIAGDSDNSDMQARKTGIPETCASAAFIADGEGSVAEVQNIVEGWISSRLINDMTVIACMDDALAHAAITVLGNDYPDIIVLGAGGRNRNGAENLQNGKMKATTSLNNVIFVEKMLNVCVDLANGVEIEFDDPENRILDPRSISLMTAETLANK